MSRIILLSFFLFFGSSSSSDLGEETFSPGCFAIDGTDEGRGLLDIISTYLHIYISTYQYIYLFYSQVSPVYFPSLILRGHWTTTALRLVMSMEWSGAPPRLIRITPSLSGDIAVRAVRTERKQRRLLTKMTQVRKYPPPPLDLVTNVILLNYIERNNKAWPI